MRTILLFTGLPGAGKTAASSYIKSKGIPVFILGDVFREEMERRGLEFTNVNSENIAVQLRKEEGTDVAANRTSEKLKKLDDELICIEGARDMSEVRCLAKLGRLILIIIDASDEIKYKRRISKTEGYKRPKNYEEFQWRTNEELKRGLKEVVKTKEVERYVIINNGTKEELHKKIDKLLEDLKIKMDKR